MPKREQKWDIGDIISIPQRDGGESIAQVIDHIMKNVVCVALYAERASRLRAVFKLSSVGHMQLLSTPVTTLRVPERPQ